MAVSKCPMCESPCMIKIIATSDKRWCEVDVCKMCGTMYPRGKVVSKPPSEALKRRAAGAKKPKKAAKKAKSKKKPVKKRAR